MGYNCGHGCTNYSCGSGNCASVEYAVKADGPQYTARVYSSSPHENFTAVKYDKVSAEYDKGTKEIIQSVQGPPLLAYVTGTTPDSVGGGGGSGAIIPSKEEILNPEIIRDNMPKEEILNEILKAQQDVLKKQIIFREVEVEEQILIRRRMRKREIFISGKKGDSID